MGGGGEIRGSAAASALKGGEPSCLRTSAAIEFTPYPRPDCCARRRPSRSIPNDVCQNLAVAVAAAIVECVEHASRVLDTHLRQPAARGTEAMVASSPLQLGIEIITQFGELLWG